LEFVGELLAFIGEFVQHLAAGCPAKDLIDVDAHAHDRETQKLEGLYDFLVLYDRFHIDAAYLVMLIWHDVAFQGINVGRCHTRARWPVKSNRQRTSSTANPSKSGGTCSCQLKNRGGATVASRATARCAQSCASAIVAKGTKLRERFPAKKRTPM
jgi:hypothetical protein